MKKVFLILLLIPFFSFSFALPVYGGGNVFNIATTSDIFSVFSSGNVNIGTSSNKAKFQIDGLRFFTSPGSSENINNVGSAFPMIFQSPNAFGIKSGNNGFQINYNNSSSGSWLFYGGDTVLDFSVSSIGAGYYRGKLGVGTTSPSQQLSVSGNVLADAYLEYSPLYVGDALAQVKQIKPLYSSLKGSSFWAEVDHATLPEGVLYEEDIVWPAVYSSSVSSSTEAYIQLVDTSKVLVSTSTQHFVGRDLGKQVQFNLRAIQQLLERIEVLEARVSNLR